MKRNTRNQCIYPRRLTSAVVVYDVRISANGRDEWQYGFATIEDARTARDEMKLTIRQGWHSPSKDEGLRLIADVITLRVESVVRRKSIQDTLRKAEWWTTYYEGKTLRDVTVESLEAVRQLLRNTGQRGRRMDQSVNHYVTFMRSVLRYSVRRGWLPFNPAD